MAEQNTSHEESRIVRTQDTSSCHHNLPHDEATTQHFSHMYQRRNDSEQEYLSYNKSFPGNRSGLFEAESAIELARLIDQHRIITSAMGGVLTGLPDLAEGAAVLDLACGPGSWVLDVAFERPDIEIAGIDNSQGMITYANARARTQRLRNASFGVMDLTHQLDFSDHTFDLINARFLGGSLKRPYWPLLCTECLRLLKPGGVLRLTETDTLGSTSSPAFERLAAVSTRITARLGYGLATQEGAFLTSLLPDLLQRTGYQSVHTIAHALDFSSGTPAWLDQFWNVQLIFRQLRPLLGLTPHEFDRLYMHLQIEMQQQDFRATWPFQSVLGTKAP